MYMMKKGTVNRTYLRVASSSWWWWWRFRWRGSDLEVHFEKAKVGGV